MSRGFPVITTILQDALNSYHHNGKSPPISGIKLTFYPPQTEKGREQPSFEGLLPADSFLHFPCLPLGVGTHDQVCDIFHRFGIVVLGKHDRYVTSVDDRLHFRPAIRQFFHPFHTTEVIQAILSASMAQQKLYVH